MDNSDKIKQMKFEINQMKKQKWVEEFNTSKGTVVDRNYKSLKEMIKSQQMIDKIISHNSDSIKMINEEIKRILVKERKKDGSRQEIEAALNKLNQDILEIKKVESEDKMNF